MLDIQNRLDHALHNLEDGLNFAGKIPILGTISAAFRAQYAKVEVIGAVAAGALLGVKALFNPTKEGRHQELGKAVEVTVTYALHGIANLFRAIMEFLPFVSWVTCVPYDNLFKQRFAYPTESLSLPTPAVTQAG